MMPPKPARVLMTTDSVGGVWVYAATLCRALASHGYEITLVVMGPAPRTAQLAGLSGVLGLHIEIADLALEWMDPQGVDTPRARSTLLRIAERIRPDVVHLNSYREGAFDWPAPVAVVAHSCVWSWWQACRGCDPDEPRWERYAQAVAAGLDAADAWVAPTGAFRDVIAAIYRPQSKGRTIRNGADVAAEPRVKRPFILGGGRLWDEAKNLAALAAIASELDWPVRVAGAASSPDKSDSVCVAGVTYLGELRRTALLAQMREAAVFVSPALYEPFGLTVLEAAASGCALVLADIPSLRELWDGAAFFVQPRDPQSLLHALRTLCRGDTLRHTLQQAARHRAERYSTLQMTAGYRALYRDVASARPLPALAKPFVELPA